MTRGIVRAGKSEKDPLILDLIQGGLETALPPEFVQNIQMQGNDAADLLEALEGLRLSNLAQVMEILQQHRSRKTAPKDGTAAPIPPQGKKVPGRNEACPCGKCGANGRPMKYKHCCGSPKKT